MLKGQANLDIGLGSTTFCDATLSIDDCKNFPISESEHSLVSAYQGKKVVINSSIANHLHIIPFN